MSTSHHSRRVSLEKKRGIELTDRRILYIFAFIIAIFLLLAYRVESNNRGIRDSQQLIQHNQLVACQQVQGALTRINQANDGIAEQLRASSPAPSPALLKFIQIFEGAHVELPTCP